MYKMICALVAPEHQGSDLLLRTNCVLWILIILFASLAWHGFVIYPFLEAAEEEKKPAETTANYIVQTDRATVDLLYSNATMVFSINPFSQVQREVKKKKIPAV